MYDGKTTNEKLRAMERWENEGGKVLHEVNIIPNSQMEIMRNEETARIRRSSPPLSHFLVRNAVPDRSRSSKRRRACHRLTERVIDFGQPVGGSRVATRQQRDRVVARLEHGAQGSLLRFRKN
jgi:hypothetical protein